VDAVVDGALSGLMSRRPNILLLQTDQHRWDALGCVNPVVKTPNLDAVAARGVRFSQAVCNNPMCVPSRYSMMTGLYSSQCGVRHNTQMCETDADMQIATMAERLRDAGYATAGFGKTHWYCGIPDEFDPAKVPTTKPSTRGFQVRAEARSVNPVSNEKGALIWEADDPGAVAAMAKENEGIRTGGENALGYIGRTSRLSPDRQREGWLTHHALQFLDGRGEDDAPFFLYLSFDFPHAALNVPEKYEEIYDIGDIKLPECPVPLEKLDDHYVQPRNVEEWRAWREDFSEEEQKRSVLRYYAACTYVDDMFGRAIDKLAARGELDNTFILFTSDHGEMLGDRYRFSKYNFYEASVRVPLIMAGAGVDPEKHGTVDDRNCGLIDVLPTMLSAAGLPRDVRLSGYDLNAPAATLGSFSELHGSGYHETEKAPAVMWRAPEWKLILYMPGEFRDLDARLDEFKGELYAIKEDPLECNNLYDDEACFSIREQLTRQLLLHMTIAWSRFPRPYSYTDIHS